MPRLLAWLVIVRHWWEITAIAVIIEITIIEIVGVKAPADLCDLARGKIERTGRDVAFLNVWHVAMVPNGRFIHITAFLKTNLV
jgi:hypothetical protein